VGAPDRHAPGARVRRPDGGAGLLDELGAAREAIPFEIDGVVIRSTRSRSSASSARGRAIRAGRWRTSIRRGRRSRVSSASRSRWAAPARSRRSPSSPRCASAASWRQRDAPQPGHDRREGRARGGHPSSSTRAGDVIPRSSASCRSCAPLHGAVPHARDVPRVRSARVEGGRRGDLEVPEHRLPGAGEGADPPLRGARGDGHRSPGEKLVTSSWPPGWCAIRGSLRARARASRGPFRAWGRSRREPPRLDREVEAHDARPAHPRPGIRHVGATLAGALARRIGSIAELRDATRERLEEVPDVGPEVSASLRGFFDDPANVSVVEKLIAAGVRAEPPPPEGRAPRGDGLRLHRGDGRPCRDRGRRPWSRREGGGSPGSVSRQVTHVVAGEAADRSSRRRAISAHDPRGIRLRPARRAG